MFRVEFDLETGERREIEQAAYRDPNDHSAVLVLDATEPVPEGMEAFDPTTVDATATDTSTGAVV